MNIDELIKQLKEQKQNPQIEVALDLAFSPLIGTCKERSAKELGELEAVAEIVRFGIWQPLIWNLGSYFDDLKRFSKDPDSESINIKHRLDTQVNLDQNLPENIKSLMTGRLLTYSDIFHMLESQGVNGYKPDFRLPLEKMKGYREFELLQQCSPLHLKNFYGVISGLEEEMKKIKQTGNKK